MPKVWRIRHKDTGEISYVEERDLHLVDTDRWIIEDWEFV